MRAGTPDDWHGRVQAFWDSVAPSYDHLYTDRWSQLEDLEVKALLSGLSGDVLDIGCGTGLGVNLVPDAVKSYVGVDISPSMIQTAENKLFERNFDISWQVENALDLPYEWENRFDCVISLYSGLNYTRNINKAIKEAVRVTKPGGTLFLMLLNQGALWNREGHRFVPYGTRRWDEKMTVELANLIDFRFIAGVGWKFSGMSLLGRVFEKPLLWGVDRFLSRHYGHRCHMIVAKGFKYA